MSRLGVPVPSGRGRLRRSGPPRLGTDRPAGHGKADVSLGLGVVPRVGSVLAADLSAEEVVHGRLSCIRVRLRVQVRRGDELAVGVLGAEGGRPVARERSAVAPEFGRASRP